MKPNLRRVAALMATVVTVCSALSAFATDIRWSVVDTFEHTTVIAAGKAAEVCGTIEPRMPVDWRFSADGPLTFDIHRHSGAEVIYATRSYLTREQNGKFSPTFNFEWCWMWVNESGADVTLRVDLKR